MNSDKVKKVKNAVMLEVTPTIEEAKQMFIDRPDLSSVLTDKGIFTRDGATL